MHIYRRSIEQMKYLVMAFPFLSNIFPRSFHQLSTCNNPAKMKRDHSILTGCFVSLHINKSLSSGYASLGAQNRVPQNTLENELSYRVENLLLIIAFSLNVQNMHIILYFFLSLTLPTLAF